MTSLFSACDSRKDYIFENLEKPVITISKNSSGVGESFITDSIKLNYGIYSIFYITNFAVKGNVTLEYDKTAMDVTLNENLHSITVKPLKSGGYYLNVNYTDVYNNTSFAKLYLNIFDNLAPVTIFEYTVTSDNRVIINLEKSFDKDQKFGGKIVEYRYQIRSNYDFNSPSPKKEIQYPSKGTFPATFWVKDNNDVWSDPLNTFITL
jgi:hypothetical protein